MQFGRQRFIPWSLPSASSSLSSFSSPSTLCRDKFKFTLEPSLSSRLAKTSISTPLLGAPKFQVTPLRTIRMMSGDPYSTTTGSSTAFETKQTQLPKSAQPPESPKQAQSLQGSQSRPPYTKEGTSVPPQPFNPTLWAKTKEDFVAPSFPAFQARQGPNEYDVLIVGGGITGLLAAAKLCIDRPVANRPKIAILEALKLANGTTSYTTAKITALHRLMFDHLESHRNKDAAQMYADMNVTGMNYIVSLAKELDIDCELQRRAHVCYSTTKEGADMIKREYQAAIRAGLKDMVTLVDGDQQTIKELPFQVSAAIKMTDQYQFNSYLFCMNLARILHDRYGCEIYENTRVMNVSKLPDQNQNHIITVENNAPVFAKKIILATHLPILDISGHFSVVSPTRSYCMAFSLVDNADLPRDMYIDHKAYPALSIRTACNDTVLVVAGESHEQGEEPQGDTAKRYASLEAMARQHFRIKEKVAQWSAFDYVAGDKLPYIGPISRALNNIYTATGFKKWGFSLAGAAAHILADCVEGREHQWMALVDARRWDLFHTDTLGGLVSAQAHVGKHFVVDRLKEINVPDIESLGTDQGGLVRANGRCVAAYRDSNGLCHALDPGCTHLNCHVLWNNSDRTWDCPCHGSRYDFTGKVLHGPTVKPLQKVNLKENIKRGAL